MDITSRTATVDDIDELTRLYRLLEEEQAALKPIWPYADGLAEPIDVSLKAIVENDTSVVDVGEIDGVPVGFMIATVDSLLPQADGQLLGTIRFAFTELPARAVGVGSAMINSVLAQLRDRGLTLFDAVVSPGHRLAKNFFEANGFSARLIHMHHSDDPTAWGASETSLARTVVDGALAADGSELGADGDGEPSEQAL